MNTPMIFLAPMLLLTACAQRSAQQAPPAVSTVGVSQSLADLGNSVASARTATEGIDRDVTGARASLSRAAALSHRMDDKAVVILKYWDTAK